VSSADDALAAADAGAVPAVSRRPSRWGLPAGVAAITMLGVATFVTLYRPAPSTVASSALPLILRTASRTADLPPPPVLAPLAPSVIPPLVAPVKLPAQPVYRAPPPPEAPGEKTSALIVDLAPANAQVDAAAAVKTLGAGDKLSANEAFADRVTRAPADTVGVDKLSSTDQVIPQGTIIVGVLETAINSDLPGQVRAMVSRDVRGFDGTRVLIPRGSRLIGVYSNGIALGQSRAFIIWTRMLRSDGVSVQLGSPVTDSLGTAGLGGKVDTHFLRRFGAATLLSVLTAGLDYLTTRDNSTQVIVATPGQANQLAAIALQRDIDLPPTIKVPQGTPIRVFVARDLDFAQPAGKRP
jgi:type IV secretory pathway VirB10-like protein